MDTQNEMARWALAGITLERAEIKKRIAVLDELEKDIRSRGVLGLPAARNGSAKSAVASKPATKAKKRKHVISEATRQKMRESQQRRHAAAKAKSSAAQPNEQPVQQAPAEETRSFLPTENA